MNESDRNLTGSEAYAGEVRPLTGEPLPLDLLNTTWIAGGEPHDLLSSEAGAREWLDEHDFDAPADAPARRALRDTRESMRALLLDRSAIDGVNAVLARGGRRPLLTADGVGSEVDAAAAWRVPWTCAAQLVSLLEERGDRIKGCANRRLHPVVPGHLAAGHPPLVLDGVLRQPRQGDPPRAGPRQSPLILL